jgi:hypothetical protein
MAMTLITTNTSSDAATSDFTSGIDSTYKLYIFKWYDVNPVEDNTKFQFQFNAVGGSGFDETVTTTRFRARHTEGDATSFGYEGDYDQAQTALYIDLGLAAGNGADESQAGELFLFNPSNTTYVKHFYARDVVAANEPAIYDAFVAGYVNTTTAIDEVSFKMSSGNMDAVISMYGVG